MTTIPAPATAGRDRTPWARLAWITWRQHRAALTGLGALLLVLAVFFAVTGPLVTGGIHTLVREHCLTGPGGQLGLTGGSHCLALWNAQRDDGWPLTVDTQASALLLMLLPLLAGVFLGAPLLAREFETGAARFAWTQAAGPVRVLVARLGLIALALAAAGAAFGALAHWWLGQADSLTSMFPVSWQNALTAGAFPGWMLALFALGVLAGAVIRQTVAAMVATAVIGVVAMFLSTLHASPAISPRMGVITLQGQPVSPSWAGPGSLPQTLCTLAAALVLGAAAVWLTRRRPA